MSKPIVAIKGEDKSGKTSFALSLPKPIRHFGLDVGGFERASWRYQEAIANGSVVSKPYYFPQQALRDKLNLPTGGVKVSIKQSKKLTGIKELWYRILEDYVSVLEDSEVSPNGKPFQTVVFDSFPQLWEICTMAYLQEKQENQPMTEKPREQLLQIEYKEPNQRMRSVVYAAREGNKYLALTHNMTDVRERKLVPDEQGRMKVEDVIVGRDAAGWKYITKECDLEVLMEMKKEQGKPVLYGEVTLDGLTLQLTGTRLQWPTWEQVEQLLLVYRQ